MGVIGVEAARVAVGETGPVRVTNRSGTSSFILICDHASNHIPAAYGTLGLGPAERSSHIAWDPGALPVAAISRTSRPRAFVDNPVSNAGQIN